MAAGDTKICWFSEIRVGDVGLVGGKNASLGKLYGAMAAEGIKVPNGFAITAASYRRLLTDAGAHRNRRHVGICGEAPANYPEIATFLAGLGIDAISVNPASLLKTFEVVRQAERGLTTGTPRGAAAIHGTP